MTRRIYKFRTRPIDWPQHVRGSIDYDAAVLTIPELRTQRDLETFFHELLHDIVDAGGLNLSHDDIRRVSKGYARSVIMNKTLWRAAIERACAL